MPEGKVHEVMCEHHEVMGHVGVQRLVKELDRRFVFPPSVRVSEEARKVKRRCATCQACEPPNWSMALPISFTPVPEHVMASVALDVFALPSVWWQGRAYDSLLLCVDRLSGWIIARPCTKLGLTAEQAAHLILTTGGSLLGYPQ